MWHLTYDEAGKKATKMFRSLNEMFSFIENAYLPRFKAKRVGSQVK